MAESAGSKLKSALILILIALLTVGLLLFAVTDAFQPKVEDAVVTVGDHSIDARAFSQVYRQQLDNRNRQDGVQKLNAIDAYSAGLGRQVLGIVGQQALIKADADDLGIGVNSRTIRNTLKDIPTFANDITGEFEESKLLGYLRGTPGEQTRKDFDNRLIYELTRDQVYPAIVSGVEAPLVFAETRFRYIYETRRADVLTLTKQVITPPEAPSDEDLKSYIAENAARYTAPEYRMATFIRVEISDLTRDIEVDEDTLRNEYDLMKRSNKLGEAEKRSFIAITAPTEALAKEAAEALAKDEAPEDIVARLGLEIPDNYDNALAEDTLDPIVGETAFTMDVDKTTVTKNTITGYSAIKLKDITPSTVKSFEDARPEIMEKALVDLAGQRLFEIDEELRDALRDGDTLEEAGAKLGISVASVDFIDRLGRTQDGLNMQGDIFPGIATDEEIMTEMFLADLDFRTDVFPTETDGITVLRVDEIIESQVTAFDEIKSIALADWMDEKTDALLADFTTEIVTRINGGEDIRAIAESIGEGATVTTETAIRANRNTDLGDLILVRIYEGEKGEVLRGPGAQDNTQQIAVITDIVSNTDTLAGRIADITQSQVEAGLSRDLITSYQNQLIGEYGYKEFPEVAKAAVGVPTSDTANN